MTHGRVNNGALTRFGAPPGSESRPLKALGLALVVAGGGGLYYVVIQTSSVSPITLVQIAVSAGLGIVAANIATVGGIVLRAGFGDAQAFHRKRHRAIALQVLAANILLPSLVWFILMSEDPMLNDRLEASGWHGWPDLAALGLIVLAVRLWRRSLRHEAIPADEAMALDPRAPVLYLRSFSDDGETFVDDAGDVGGWLLQASRTGAPEEEMAAILARIGPVITIGKPGEPLPELGAARLYAPHDQWQDRVTELMQRATLVVVRVGSSPGVLWEIEQALAHLPRQRLVLAILGTATVAPELVAQLVLALGPSFEAALPEARSSGWQALMRAQSSRRIGGLICFTVDGTAKAVPMQHEDLSRFSRWDLRHLTGKLPVRSALERAWDEVFLELALPQGRNCTADGCGSRSK